jgi:hypothetical protein
MHWTHGGAPAYRHDMYADDVQPDDPIRYGAYVCLTAQAQDGRRDLAGAAVPALAERLGLRNEYDPGNGDVPQSIAYLRRLDAQPGTVADDTLRYAEAVVHVAAPAPEQVTRFCAEIARLVEPDVRPYVLAGVFRLPVYTGRAMYNFAYAHRVLQQPGPVMPNAFLVPMRKSDRWWAKDWMQRHTYFLPRYDEDGAMTHEGHALAAARGIGCLMRRTYKHRVEPAPAGGYDFVNYFECADADVATFHEVCSALRDVSRNPEWRFVTEGPTWHGRRVASWSELFS